MVGHTHAVTSITFISDGDRLASCSLDGTVRLWNACTGDAIESLIVVADHTSQSIPTFLIISPNGRSIASCSGDALELSKIQDVSPIRLIRTNLNRHTKPITCIVFSPDSNRLASCSEDQTVWLWDVRKATAIGRLDGHTDFITAVVFSPDSAFLASCSKDMTLRLWDTEKASEIGAVESGHTAEIKSIALAGCENEHRLFSWSSDGTVVVWDVEKRNVIARAFVGSVTSVAFSPDGKHFASASLVVRLWNAQTGDAIGDPLIDHDGRVDLVTFSPDSIRFASWGQEQTVKIWDVRATHDFARNVVGHTDGIYSFAYSPNFQYIVSLSFDKTARLWLTNTAGVVGEPMAGHTGLILSVIFSPDNERLATRSEDQTIRLWDIPTTRVIGEALGHAGAIYSAVFSSDSKLLASCSRDRAVQIWDIDLARGGSRRYLLSSHEGATYHLAFSPESTYLAGCSTDNTVRLWNVCKGQEIAALHHKAPINSVVFSPDPNNCYLASCSEDGSVEVWAVSTTPTTITANKIGKTMRGHAASVYSVIFSPSGKRLASCSHDKTIRIWNAETATAIDGGRIAHSTWIDYVTFSSDSSLTSCAIGEAYRWEESVGGGGIVDGGSPIVPVEVRENWLLVHGQKTLWIPLLYRGGAVQSIMQGNKVTVCIGCNTGSVVYVRLPTPT